LICFVAARFLPGGNITREKLMPAISSLLRKKFPVSRGGDDDELTTLQALAVLYVYRSATSPSSFEDLAHWRIKAIVEAYAIHIGCHRSVNELRNLIRSRAPTITSSKSYISLVTGSPPSIVEDATIRLAPEVLRVLHNRDSITRMLGEVELCLLWNQVGSTLHCRIFTTKRSRLASGRAVLENGGVRLKQLVTKHLWQY
jgi:hypothetical protein